MIAVNQAGYEIGAAKHATVMGGGHFRLYSASGEVVLEGDAAPVADENSGGKAGCIDFSSVDTAGTYYFEDAAGQRSVTFPIKKKVYADVFRDALRMLYFQRCGIALKKEYAGVYAHAACHCMEAKLLYSDPAEHRKLKGGWHDAGDYGRYVTPGAVTIAHLLYAYLLKPKAFKQSMNIPESGNGMPDVLNECAWELDWILKMQDKDGGVHHKATSASFVDFIMPEDDQLEPVITPVSSLATADTAAVMALAARVYAPFDEKRAGKYRRCALKAAKWLKENPGLQFKNPSEIHTGTYEDVCDADERLWAAAELFLLTEDKAWLWSMRMILEVRLNITALGWADVGGLAGLAVFTAPKKSFPADLENKFRSSWLDEAERLKKLAKANPYELALRPYDFVWGSNMRVLCNAMVLLMAGSFSKDKEYTDLARFQLDYVLVRNAMDTSYVTGHGERSFKDPHNRPTVADGIEAPIPGYVSGGPNYRPGDTMANAETLKGAAPMKCYVDSWKSYSTNEIAIYWNSPLVFVLALLA
ncbi:MAG: glycoside hydrolase family 9 protein [Lachnospiraceae bacterium]|nr:glycoside hydrolase family 9 protein [Lachnospiraceae bacterium]